MVRPNWPHKGTNKYGRQLKTVVNHPVQAAWPWLPGRRSVLAGSSVRRFEWMPTAFWTDTARLEWQGSFTIVYYGGSDVIGTMSRPDHDDSAKVLIGLRR